MTATIVKKKKVKESEMESELHLTSQEQDHAIIIDISKKTSNQCSAIQRMYEWNAEICGRQ